MTGAQVLRRRRRRAGARDAARRPGGAARPAGRRPPRSGASCWPAPAPTCCWSAFAAVGWWQLRAQPTGAGAARRRRPGARPRAAAHRRAPRWRCGWSRRRCAAPTGWPRRARGLVLPLAAFEAARRPQAVAAGLLIGLACAAATFGIAFDATWQRSQHDQADAVRRHRPGAHPQPPRRPPGRAPRSPRPPAGRSARSTDRGIAVGQWLGAAGEAPRLVAVDTTRAAALLRGRLDGGRGWAERGRRARAAGPRHRHRRAGGRRRSP